MSRKQRTTLHLSVSMPLPVGMTQKAAVEAIRYHIQALDAKGFLTHEAIIKLVGKETHYL
jgi:hypothetical protein